MAGQQKLDSLVDAGAAAAPAKPGRFAPKQGGGMNAQDRMKAAAAAVIILAAGAGLAAYYGVFSTPPKALPAAPVAPPNAAPPAPEDKQAIEDQQRDTEEQIKAGEAEKSGSG